MPRLSDSMEEGTIIAWLKRDGDEVRRGDDLVEIETDKAVMVYQADADGRLEILVGEGETRPVGEPIANLHPLDLPQRGGPGEVPPVQHAASSVGRPEETAAEPSRQTSATSPTPSPTTAEEPGQRIKASPIARRIAKDLGLDLREIRGSGPGGRILKADVEAAASERDGKPKITTTPPPAASSSSQQPEALDGHDVRPAPPTPPSPGGSPQTAKGEVQVRELNRIQQLVAQRMAQSKATVPDFTVEVEVDMEAALALVEQLKQVPHAGSVPSVNHLTIKAAALALREFPLVNGAYRDGHFELYSRVNIGMAVASEEGLVVPTIFDADQKSLGQIAAEARRLSQRVRDGSITPPELAGGTFTISNLGMYGVTRFAAIVNPSQAAILAVGTVEERVVAHNGEPALRHRMNLTLTCDHRILYGAHAAEFLAAIKRRLEQPLELAF